MQDWYYVESLTGQRHDRVQTESQIATVNSCFDLFGSLQHCVASCSKYSAVRLIFTNPLYADGDDLRWNSNQIFANWPMSHTKRVTRDNRKSPEYRVVAAIRKLRTDTNCPAGKSWPNHVKNEQHIGSEKTHGPKYWKVEMMQRTANENVARLRRVFLGLGAGHPHANEKALGTRLAVIRHASVHDGDAEDNVE